jgi:hypothetical protein
MVGVGGSKVLCAAHNMIQVRGCKIFKEDGSFDKTEADAFLKAYWQKQPVLLRQAFPFESPISPDELAGLSLEVRSRTHSSNFSTEAAAPN